MESGPNSQGLKAKATGLGPKGHDQGLFEPWARGQKKKKNNNKKRKRRERNRKGKNGKKGEKRNREKDPKTAKRMKTNIKRERDHGIERSIYWNRAINLLAAKLHKTEPICLRIQS